MTPSLQLRLRQYQQRLVVRGFQYRQRNLAAGAWDRLRRVLALSEHAFVVDDAVINLLVAQGYPLDAVGAAFEPTKRIIAVPTAYATGLETAREIQVSLGSELLLARNLVLVQFK